MSRPLKLHIIPHFWGTYTWCGIYGRRATTVGDLIRRLRRKPKTRMCKRCARVYVARGGKSKLIQRVLNET